MIYKCKQLIIYKCKQQKLYYLFTLINNLSIDKQFDLKKNSLFHFKELCILFSVI